MILLFFISTLYAAAVTENYQGVATLDGKVVYTEFHEVVFDNNKPLSAKTLYKKTDGTLIASLTSDFTKSITNAENEFIDMRSGRKYGVKWDNQVPMMWDQEKGEKIRTEILDKDYAQGKLIMGGQGLHYYMRDHLDEFEKKEIPIAILIPGKLDYYSFLVNFSGRENGLRKYNIKAQSALLRLFAPLLEVWYSDDGKLVKYRGLSNIPDDKGGNQTVEINYQY
ncbi:MAG: hypothetical protein K2P81_14450 [Bacteriovoracaceae bacterium]|nr:hypothetical protein [Bacteriovoracaceae bacterium]